MKLLLDTHIWIWYLSGNPHLSENLQSVISEETTEL
jgi:PIN domain nuclease of toxin-antitoxin system